MALDADLQDDPAILPDLVLRWREGFDVVTAVRTDRHGDSWTKRLWAGLYHRLFNALSDRPLTPGAGDYRLLDRKAVDALLRLGERSRFMKGLFGSSDPGTDP